MVVLRIELFLKKYKIEFSPFTFSLSLQLRKSSPTIRKPPYRYRCFSDGNSPQETWKETCYGNVTPPVIPAITNSRTRFQGWISSLLLLPLASYLIRASFTIEGTPWNQIIETRSISNYRVPLVN